MKTRRYLVKFARAFLFWIICGHSVTLAKAEEVDEFERFSKRLPAMRMRAYVRPQDAAVRVNTDPVRTTAAIQESVKWIKTVLKPEYIPSDLESLLEALPAGMEKRDSGRYAAAGPRYDCTKAEFEKGGHRFLVTQEAGFISIFVMPVDGDPSDRVATHEALAKFLKDQSDQFFNHATASLYHQAIRLTDYGVETTVPWDAQYPDDRVKGWKPTVVIPPKAVDDGVMSAPGSIDYDAFVRKLKNIDPTIPADEAQSVEFVWWGRAYVASDGRTLFYHAPKKLAGGQSPNSPDIPDWFRIPNPGEIPPKPTSKIDPVQSVKP